MKVYVVVGRENDVHDSRVLLTVYAEPKDAVKDLTATINALRDDGAIIVETAYDTISGEKVLTLNNGGMIECIII